MSRIGSDVLLYVDPFAAPVAMQRDVTFTENTAVIDVSNKDERFQRVLAGRYSSEVTLDALYIHGDVGYIALRAAMRAGDDIVIERRETAGADPSFADAIVTSISDRFPDSGESTVSISLVIDGEWRATAV
jgi:predicted secreted protein